MRGTIKLINNPKGMLAVETEEGQYSVIELLGEYSPEVGDIVSGNLESTGGETLRNVTQRQDWNVFIQNANESRERAIKSIS
jgi:exosome complex RNA-binding protein Rrp4